VFDQDEWSIVRNQLVATHEMTESEANEYLEQWRQQNPPGALVYDPEIFMDLRGSIVYFSKSDLTYRWSTPSVYQPVTGKFKQHPNEWLLENTDVPESILHEAWDRHSSSPE
jgi:hypothetical protein